ncbi:MAG: DUF1449 family protein [Bacteroidales bacterium]|jgi:hypothetical protein|nr:DUF1449 family protein [Bacteroidales bacterium]
MSDILHTLFNPLPNAVMTVLVGVLALYWLYVMLGGAGFGDLDLGVDFDAGVDAGAEIPDVHTGDIDTGDTDADTDADGHVHEAKTESVFVKFLHYLNVGKVPFMLVLSTFKFLSWICTLITTKFLLVDTWGWKSILILIPIFAVGILLTGYATTPMARFFKQIGYQGEEEIDFLGRSGKMRSTIKGDKIGFAEFMVERNPMKLNVKSHTGEEIAYGDQVMVTDESDDRKIYFVTKEITL